MPKVRRSSSLSLNRSRASPYPCTSEDAEHYKLNSPLESTENAKEWEDTRCPICMEHPHNAVLIKCSSHEKGCRPYMCNTSYRHSNCLDQFCKSSVPDSAPMMLQELPLTHTASHSSREEELLPEETIPCGSQLQLHPACPLCRGKIYGFIVVGAARYFMNCKVRSCSSETCDFSGTYSELRKHARSEHPYVRPSEVDPDRHREWMRLEQQRDLEDVLSIVQVGSGDDIIPDLSTDSSGWTNIFSVILRTIELMYSSHWMESLSDIEQTHSRRSGRTTRVQQVDNTVFATRRNNTVSESSSRSPGLLWRAQIRSNDSYSGEADHIPLPMNHHAPPPRRSNNSLTEASRATRRGPLSEEGTNRVHRRSNNHVSDSTLASRWSYRSVPEEGNRASRWGSSSVLEESNNFHRRHNNSVSEESRWGNSSLSEEAGNPSRWGNTSVPEITPRPGRLRFRHGRESTYHNRR